MNPVQPVVDALDVIIKNVEQSLAVTEQEQDPTHIESTASASNTNSEQPNADGAPDSEKKKKKEKKPKKPKQPTAPVVPPAVAQLLQCDLRVGRVSNVEHHPEADGLFKLQVSYGDFGSQTVCAGLRKFLSDDDMRDRMVITICNLKPRKLRGVDSEAMILAGSVVSSEGSKETVVPVASPPGAREGDIISVHGMEGERTVVDGKYVSGKTWDKVVHRLSVRSENACYDGAPLMVADEHITCNLPDGAEIH